MSDGSTINCLAVVLCCPPAAAAKIEMHPPLSPQRLNALESCQTWMSAVLKFSVIYKTPFWRDEDLSGYCMIHFEQDHEKHIVECCWDNTDCQTFALAGFARPPKEDEDEETTKFRIFDDLELLLGEQAKMGRIEFKNWSNAIFNVDAPGEEKQHRNYGHALLKQPHARRVIFGGTETENENGHMEGAITSGRRAANEAYSVMLGKRLSNRDSLGNAYT